MPKQGNYRYVIHTCDALMSYPKGRAATTDSAKVIADFIFQDILCQWGGLEEIVTDNSTAYIAALDILSKRYGIRHIQISGYNSQANGIIESKHFDVRESIMKTCDNNESKWHETLPLVLWAERVTIQKATGYSPYFMVHGTHPLLPFDIVEATYCYVFTPYFPLSTPQTQGHTHHIHIKNILHVYTPLTFLILSYLYHSLISSFHSFYDKAKAFIDRRIKEHSTR
jgi:hypothetical protein